MGIRKLFGDNLQSRAEIIGTTAENGVLLHGTSNVKEIL